jgi:hypothetical protein
MQLRHRQQGLGWFGLLFILGVLAFVAIVGLKTLPIYLNQMKLQSALNKVASEPNMGGADPARGIRNSLQKYWDIDDINRIQPKDVKIKRTEQGRFLTYDYEAKERLFYNIYIVIHFAGDVRMSDVQS